MTSTPNSVSELPAFVLSSLTRLSADCSEAGFNVVIEQIVRTMGADSGFLVDLPHGGDGGQVVSQWTRPGLTGVHPLDLHLCPWILAQLLRGEAVTLMRGRLDVPSDATDDQEYLTTRGVQSMMLVVIPSNERQHALAVQTTTREAWWGGDVAQALRQVAEILAVALNTRRLQQELASAKADLTRFSQRLESQTRVFKEDIQAVHDFDDIVGTSPAFLSALASIREVAATDTTVLLLGETGTGKELFARALHDRSARRHRPLVSVNCAALPASLIESELFGHERGAFTGAITARQGRFELADRGTLFLDEIGDLPLELQPKLLRVLQEREFERVGSSTRRRVDVRVIAATHHDLNAAVAQGRFRADLYYRLSIFPITLPPLRQRREDIPQLVWFLINQRQRRLHRHITTITAETTEALQRYHWPGNVRELENVVERAMIRSLDGTLRVDEPLIPDQPVVKPAADEGTLMVIERAHIEAMLRACRWRINGRGNAAERLGLHPNTLRFRMKKLGIVRRTAPDSGTPAEAVANDTPRVASR